MKRSIIGEINFCRNFGKIAKISHHEKFELKPFVKIDTREIFIKRKK